MPRLPSRVLVCLGSFTLGLCICASLVAAGPDRISGGAWEAAPYVRDYFHCVAADGRLVLLFRTAGQWYLHGWWD